MNASAHRIESHSQPHVYLGDDHARNERRTWWVVGITAAMMVVEIVAGLAFGSMALLADGAHMATHAGALAIAGFAYAYARRHAEDPRYTFGTGKVGDLAGFSSALLLGVFAIGIAIQSFERLLQPVEIAYREAIVVAVVGLLVNLVCALVLQAGGNGHAHVHGHDHHGHDDGHGHDHGHGHDGHSHHGHGHDHGAALAVPARAAKKTGADHTDHNLRSAYVHVLADALTSVMAIIALAAAALGGWVWLDPLIGVVGALIIARWSYTLMRDTGRVLLDASGDPELDAQIRARIETGGDRIADQHLWRVGPGRFAAIVVVVTNGGRTAPDYQRRLAGLSRLAHVTIEVQDCAVCAGPAPAAHRS